MNIPTFEFKRVPGRFFLYAVSAEGIPIGCVRHNTITWEIFSKIPSIGNPQPIGFGFATRDAGALRLLKLFPSGC